MIHLSLIPLCGSTTHTVRPSTTWSHTVLCSPEQTRERDQRNPPGVEHGPVLEEALLVDQQHVSVLGLAAAEEGPVQHLHLHLGLRQLPGGAGGQQSREEAAERGHQHAAAPLPALVEPPSGTGWFDVATFIAASQTHRIGCSLLAHKPRPQRDPFRCTREPPTCFFYCWSGTHYIHARGVCDSELHASHRPRKDSHVTSGLGWRERGKLLHRRTCSKHLNWINTINMFLFFALNPESHSNPVSEQLLTSRGLFQQSASHQVQQVATHFSSRYSRWQR